MSSKVTVVMYHYVRDLKHSRYPSIKGLDRDLFVEQVEYLCKHYVPVTMEQVVAASRPDGEPLPEKAVLLTFDDGYADHFTTVFPILKNRGVQGSFFAPIKALTENRVLDVNKIHFILASGKTAGEIIALIRLLLPRYAEEYRLQSFEYYYGKLAGFDRFDTPEVLFIKRLLQVELPLEVRMKITDELFAGIVGMDESAFSRELYMDREQMQCMVDAGMHIGSHGYDHFLAEFPFATAAGGGDRQIGRVYQRYLRSALRRRLDDLFPLRRIQRRYVGLAQAIRLRGRFHY